MLVVHDEQGNPIIDQGERFEPLDVHRVSSPPRRSDVRAGIFL